MLSHRSEKETIRMKQFFCALLTLGLCLLVRAETITVASYNIQLFHKHFVPSTQPIRDPELSQDLRHLYDKENWVVAQTILNSEFNPDIIVIEECCGQEELEKFNDRWLNKAFETVKVFPTNTDHDQHLAMMLKPGFKVVEQKSDYYKEPDSVGNERGARLFARGPSFCLIESPSGYRFWVGVTHQKSKRQENAEQAKWRLREAMRTHEIMKELQKQGPTDVMLLGDMNDEYGYNEFELEAGGDSISTLIGAKDDEFFLATKPLADAGSASFGGFWRTDHRTLIDHIIMTPSLKDQVLEVQVFQKGYAPVASDHYPVYVKIKADPVNK